MTPAALKSVTPKRTPILGLLGVLTLYYTFVVSAGTFQVLDWSTRFYDMLAEGMLHGHLYIPERPADELLARPDPYAWESGADWDAWLWDASLYKGRYYIYWGPTPALVLVLFKRLTGYEGPVHDQWLVLFFMLMRLYAGAGLILSYARTQNPHLPSWSKHLAILVFGLASPTPYFLARPHVYEASIAGGQGCAFLGLFFAYQGLINPRAQMRWFVAAGSSFAFALASRGSMIVAVPPLIIVTALAAARPAGYARAKLLRSLFALGIPPALGLALYALYNQLRFDAFYEFGLRYQLTGRPFGNHIRFFLPNLFSYLGNAISWSCRFPFVRLPERRKLSHLIDWPDDYDIGDYDNGERVAGILFATAICWLWMVWLWRGLVALERVLWPRQCMATEARAPVASSTRELWLVGCALALCCAMAPTACMWMANMRFLQDAAGGILLGAIGAAFWLLRPVHARDRSRTRTRALLGPVLYVSLALHSLFVGVGLGFTGFMDTFPKENPELIQVLQRKLSVCHWKRKLKQLRAASVEAFDGGALPVACRDAQRPDTSPQGSPACTRL